MKSNELSIIVYSCKKNADMWVVFSKLFKKYWETCRYQVLLVTDGLPCEKELKKDEYVFDKIVIKDAGWAEMIFSAINVAQTPYCMLWMDDYLLCDYVKNDDIETMMNIMKKYNAANLRLMDSPMIPYEECNHEIGKYKAGTAYSVSTQVGIWSVDFLNKNIDSNWTAWDFERKGSIEIRDSRPYLISLRYTFPYEEAVRRGKWMDNGVRLCKRNNINLDFSKRAAMNNWELAKIFLKGAIIEINPTLVLKIQNFLSKK